MASPFDLSGAVALVTGAGRPDGIGFACARLLGSLGARLVLTATGEHVHERAAELEATGVVADLRRPQDAERVVAAAVDRWGRLDVVVDNLGMTGGPTPAPVQALDDAAWADALARNLSSAMHVSRGALPSMLAAGRGRIVMRRRCARSAVRPSAARRLRRTRAPA